MARARGPCWQADPCSKRYTWQADPCSKRCSTYVTAHILEEAVWQRYCQVATHPEQLLDVWLHSVEHVAKQYEQARRRHGLLLAELQEHQETADCIDLALLGKDGEEERHAP
jgi:hypothetical protein